MQLVISTSTSASDLDRAIARAALSRNPTLVSRPNYTQACEVMGRELTPEVITRLGALHCVSVSTLPDGVIDWLNELATAILA